jgi:hypothetical protein
MALVTLEEYLAYANIPASPPNEDQIEAALTRAAAEIERLTQREFDVDTSPFDGLSPVEVLEVFDGTDSFRYFTRQAPIVDVSKLECWDGTQWVSVDDVNMTYSFNMDEGQIYFEQRYKFTKGYENWRVTYTYDPTAPEDLKLATLMIAQHIVSSGKFAGLSSQSDGEQSFSYKLEIPQEAYDICQRYRRY